MGSVELVRTWVRWTSTALGASLLVPAAVMVVAAGVAVGGGGLGGIGALGQLIDGPRNPLPVAQALSPADDTLAADPSALITSSIGPGDGAAAGGGGDGGGAPSTGGDRGGSGGSPGGGAPGGDGGGGGDPGGGGGGTPGSGGGGGDPQPGTGGDLPSTSTPAPLQGIENGTEDVVEQLPRPVGPISGDVIDQVVELGEQVLGGPGGGGLLGSLNGSP